MAKRKLFDDDVMTGYLLQISKVETSASGKTKYFSALLQNDKNEARRLVCFHPEKHELFVRAKEIDRPVRLHKAKLTPGRDGMEVRFQRESSLEILQAPISFPKLQTLGESSRDDGGPNQHLCELKTENMRVTVKVKIVGFLTNKKETPTKYGLKYTREAAVADPTKSMRITFWGDTSELVQTGKSYLISHVSTRMFNGELTLNTTMSTKISQIEDVEDPKEDLTFIEEKEEIISISQIKITQNYKCCNTSCNKTIPEIDFHNSFIRCQACQMKQSIKKMKRATTAFLNVTLENSTTTKFVIFEEALHKFLDLEKNAQLLENPDQLEDHLLEIEQFKVSHQSHSDVLSKINRIAVSNQSE